MKDNTEQILLKVNEVIEVLETYKEHIAKFNSCAYSDRLLESAVLDMNMIKKLHESQFDDISVKEDNKNENDEETLKRMLQYVVKRSNLADINHELESERRLRLKSLPEKFTVKDYCQGINYAVRLIPSNRNSDNEINVWLHYADLTYAMQNAVVKEIINFDTLLLESTDKELLEADLEHLGWNLKTHDDYWCLETWSPLGENLIIETNGDIKAFVNEIRDVYSSYDTNEHAKFWISNSDGNGVPQSAEDLVEDAKEIEEMYDQLREIVDAYSLDF